MRWGPTGEPPPVPARLPGLRRAAARHIAALAARRRRCGRSGPRLDRPAPRGRAGLVAGAAAGANGLLMSPDWLIEDGLLRVSDCQGRSFSSEAVDYDAVASFKHRLLETAWTNFTASVRPD